MRFSLQKKKHVKWKEHIYLKFHIDIKKSRLFILFTMNKLNLNSHHMQFFISVFFMCVIFL